MQVMQVSPVALAVAVLAAAQNAFRTKTLLP
jgi:hypothetical protein